LPWRTGRARWTRRDWVRALRGLRPAGWALTVALLTLWWYHGGYSSNTPWVYVVYQRVMLFACDLAAAATLGLWLVERVLRGAPPRLGPRGVFFGGLALIGACALSLQDSVVVPLTLGLLAHLLLLGGWYLMLVNDPPTPRTAGLVLAGVLGAQALLAVVQAVTQTTVWLEGLGLPWPGTQYPDSPGVSVVQTAGGGRWLRAYGTLSHPNILGGYLVLGLGVMVERYRATRARGWLLAAWLVSAGLLLTFSRSAWVGAAVMAGGVFWLTRQPAPRSRPDWPRVRRWAAASLGALTLLSLPVLPMLLARTTFGAEASRLEQRSMDDRQRLNQAAAEMLADRPLSGVGAGTFVVRLYQVAGVNLPLEPAHNLPLLLGAEMGLPGIAAQSAILAALAWRLWRRRKCGRHESLYNPAEQVFGAVLVGLLVIGFFDHYWWTMPPARMALATVLGLWVGWGEASEAGAIRAKSREHSGGVPPVTQSAAPPPG
jgi:O-antigen ligase